MKEMRHPLTGAVYGVDPETGLVRVDDDGKVGWFTYLGVWQSGDVFDVDPELCNWIGGPQPETVYTKAFKTV